MFFASDNSGPAHPRVLQALVAANQGYMASYGADPIMDRVTSELRDLFEAPEAAIYLVATGTAANSLLLASMARPWDTIFCTSMAHINEDECNAPEFFTGGAKLTLVADTDGRMRPQALHAAILKENNRGVHGPQRGPVALTQVTEKGTLYSLDELRMLTGIAREFGLKVHMDGARFANALAALGCTPAEMTWKAGIDAVSFGGTKNGLMGVEACIIFDPAIAWEFELRRKRAGHLFSKHRYLSAQMEAYLQDDLWLEMARDANAACARLVAGIQGSGAGEMAYPPEANMAFVRFPRHVHQRLFAAGAVYSMLDDAVEDGPPDELLLARLVCDWSMSPDNIDQFVQLLAN